jgi:hypothetical protein
MGKEAHGDFGLMHADMVQHFEAWSDEMSVRTLGFKLSELHAIEQAIARLYIAVSARDASVDGSSDAAIEFDRLTKKYREVWLPRRNRMMGL